MRPFFLAASAFSTLAFLVLLPDHLRAQTPETHRATGQFQSVIHLNHSLRDIAAGKLLENTKPMPEGAKLVRHLEAMELAIRAYNESNSKGVYVFGDKRLRDQYDTLHGAQERPKGFDLLSQEIYQNAFERLAWEPVYHWQVLETFKPKFARTLPASCMPPGITSSPTPTVEATLEKMKKLNALKQIDDDERKGFLAVTYVNHRSRRVVIAIAGTDKFSLADLTNDLDALRGKRPPHFDVACAYMHGVVQRFQTQFKGYTFECSGHSLGGGTCSYAGSRLGRPGTTLNPIGTTRPLKGLLGKIRSGMANFIDPDDMAFHAYKTAGRVPSGRIYWISDRTMTTGMLSKFYQIIRPKSASQRIVGAFKAHKAGRSLDRLVTFEGLRRIPCGSGGVAYGTNLSSANLKTTISLC